MLSLSQTAVYAVHAASCLRAKDVAKRARIPKPYLAKTINQLSRKGLVATRRGQRGGIFLTRPAAQISILEIIEAVEKRPYLGKCLLGLQKCKTHCSCPTKTAWTEARTKIEQTLRNTTLADVVGCARRKTV